MIDSEPASGAWNMACDEALLTASVEADSCAFRLYTWAEPTVSLGYFQSADDPAVQERFATLAKVRRLSGGGAILHHHEVTYSCCIPARHPAANEPGKLYDRVHALLIELLRELGVAAAFRGESSTAPEPFLCFGRGDARDIVLEGHKIVGSAQRRRSGAVLQHGSLLLRRSQHAPEFPGLLDLIDTEIDVDSLVERFANGAASLLGQVEPGSLNPAELALSRRLANERYRHLDDVRHPVPRLSVD